MNNGTIEALSVALQPLTRQEQKTAERRAKRWWMSGILALLGMQIAIGIAAVYLSQSDQTVAVIPDYYHSAVNWDTERRARHLAQRLGWQVAARFDDLKDGKRELKLEIRDKAGSPIRNVRVSAKVFHHARGADIYELRFKAAPDEGLYSVLSPMVQTGLWQLSIRVEGDDGILAFERQLDVKD